MPTDATGTPTALGIPKYNTNVDAPSGLGFNAAMDAIDALIAGRMAAPSSPATGDVPVWNGSAWVKSSTTKMAVSGIAPGSNGQALVTSGGATAWGSAGAVTLIDDYTVTGSALAAYDTNTRLGGNIPSTYKHLRLVFRGTGDNAAAQWVNMRLNNISTATYYGQYMTAAGATQANGEQLAQTSVQMFQLGTGAGLGANADLSFEDYTGTAVYMAGRSNWAISANNSSGTFRIGQSAGWQNSLAAITRITLTPAAGNFVIGSRFSLYGIS